MRYLAVATSFLAVTLSVACSSSAPTSPSGVEALTEGVAAPPLAPPATFSVDDEVSATTMGNAIFKSLKRATAAFHDVDKAVRSGYLAPNAAECVASPAGGMGIHAVNPALAGDQVIDPLRPEVLLYAPKNGGGFRLVGVEYFQAVLVRNRATGAVSPWFAQTPWSESEYDVVTPRPSVFGQAFDGPMPGHEPNMPWHYDLHVWVWSQNPSGDFAPFNPRVMCHGGAHAHE